MSISLLDQFATSKTIGKLGRITFAKTSGSVTRDRGKTGQQLTGPSLVMIPLTIAGVADEEFNAIF